MTTEPFTLTPSPADPPRGNYGYSNRVAIACRDAYERDFVSELDGFDIPVALMNAINEIERLHALINSPHTADFMAAVQCEAAHQRERWGSEHDAGKTDADWFWLVGYLAGKALSIEILRCCTDGTRNACSMIYGACRRAAIALGFRRVITYCHKDEPGASLRAAGFRVVADVRGRNWNCRARPRVEIDEPQDKLRWEAA